MPVLRCCVAATARPTEVVGRVEAAGTSSSLRQYRLLDTQLPTGLLYYRLRQLDLDGKATFSAVITLRKAGTPAGLIAYPNPAHGALMLQLDGTTPTSVQVLDLQGRIVLSQPWPATGQLNLSVLPLALTCCALPATGRRSSPG